MISMLLFWPNFQLMILKIINRLVYVVLYFKSDLKKMKWNETRPPLYYAIEKIKFIIVLVDALRFKNYYVYCEKQIVNANLYIAAIAFIGFLEYFTVLF